ncbi:type II CAAX endopeptidase family protein [Nocardioides panzhihuensis]|uniref:Membrane protease YdiL (CAAX protease family) n=1 Tax=Nocardioides panzhihuensis TaxID=860243 RepID=A0A7Z0IT38_9ACTN|nr:type II CAAX endopeptidase family protein [Nocardioides panzhihuensis]NYI78515.1 membrane protease YdiL (CAAX protease family) [Nocardioides panzhihuensis]
MTTTQPVTQPLTPPLMEPEQGIRAFVRGHQLSTFFVLALAASWLAWTPYILSNSGLGVWDLTFPGGMIGGQLLGMLPGAYLGPIGSAALVTGIVGGRAGLRAWVAGMWRWRASWRWYAGILIGVPAAIIVATQVTGGQMAAPSQAWLFVLVAYVPGLLLQMITTGLAEEPGWRDFALPRLQRKVGPLGSAFVLGPIWALWHMPLFLTDWAGPEVSWYAPFVFTAFCVTFGIVMTWVFNRTGASLPLAMLLHTSVNNYASVASTELFPGVDADEFQLALLLAAGIGAVVVILATRGRLGYVKERARSV